MRARLVVFPVRGRQWCFSRSMDPSIAEAASDPTPSSLKGLWNSISTSNSHAYNAELIVDFVSNKMNRAWAGLEKAPQGTLKSKIHGLGLKLLARVKPSEIFLKSISKDVTGVEIIYPSSLNARLVRRRLRHTAMRGAAIHKKYFYGSVSLLPLTTAFTVLPLPNIPFFWILFRTYSHWRALKGSETLLELVSDSSCSKNTKVKENEIVDDEPKYTVRNSIGSPWVLQPSRELEELLEDRVDCQGLSKRAMLEICNTFRLDKNEVQAYVAV